MDLGSPTPTFTPTEPTPETTLAQSSPTETPPTAPEPTQPTPTPEAEPLPQGTGGCAEKAAFFADITVPDGTFFRQGEPFVKTWRFRNEGTCTWTPEYAAAFHSGENMNAPLSVPFTQSVPPGETLDISIDMQAPTRGGLHQGNWEFINPEGVHFGTGNAGKDIFWVQIDVRFLDQNDQPQPDPGSSPPSPPPAGCDAQPDPDFESQVIASVNQARSANGLAPLSANQFLTAAARDHSTDMACNSFVGHTGSNGSKWSDRISAQGYAIGYASENIYYGFPDFGGTPVGAFEWWMNSQIHRENILTPQITEIGVGYIYSPNSEYGGYYTINFAQPGT